MSPDRKPESLTYNLLTDPERPKSPEVTVTGRVVNIREGIRNGKVYHSLIFALPDGKLKRVTLFGRGTEVDMKLDRHEDGWWQLNSISKHEPGK